MDEITKGETLQTNVPQAYRERPKPGPDIFVPESKHSLDTPEKQKDLRDLMNYRRQARLAQAENRIQQAIDEDFYDSIQLEPEELNILLQRSQAPLTFNVIKNTMNWLLGTERKSRIDYRILPRKKKASSSAKAKTKVFKYIQDCSRGEYARSEAFTEAVCAGVGWMEYGARFNGDNEPIYMRSERWRNMWFDHLGLEADCSDWRYVYREKWIDLDIALGLFPERETRLKALAESVNSLYPYIPDDIVISDPASEFDFESELDVLGGGPFDGSRERIKVVEMWYRKPDDVKLLRMRDNDTPYGALNGAIFRPTEPDHQYLVRGNYFTLSDARVLTVRCAMWAGAIFLQDDLSPYNHNRFPFVPIFCYRRKRDNMPYGIIRDLRDPQSDLNRRKTRSLFILASNQIIAEKGAVDDLEKTAEEAKRPDGVILYNNGKKLEFRKDYQAIADNAVFAKEDEEFIQKIAGVTDPSLGREKHDLSGKAIDSLQLQSLTSHGVAFDNLYYAFQNGGDQLLSLIEQFKDQEEEIRITGDQRKDEFVEINKRKEGKVLNSIVESKADFIVSKQDFRETLRLAMLETMSKLVESLSASMPNVALALLDLVVDLMDDLPNKDEIVARIREINKQHGAEEDMTPEEKQAVAQFKQQAAQEQAAVKQIQMAMAQAQLAVKQAEAGSKQSTAMKNQVEAMVKKIEAFLKALEAAGRIAIVPEIVGAADRLIAEAQVMGGNGGQRGGQIQRPGGPPAEKKTLAPLQLPGGNQEVQ